MRNMHTGERVISKCNMCTFQTKYEWNLRNHIKQIHAKRGKDSCIECNKLVKPEYMNQHMRNMHTGERVTLNCNMCPFQTKYEGNLRSHIRIKHT